MKVFFLRETTARKKTPQNCHVRSKSFFVLDFLGKLWNIFASNIIIFAPFRKHYCYELCLVRAALMKTQRNKNVAQTEK